MSRNPLAGYHDWATSPVRRTSLRFWLSLPLLLVIPLFVLAAAAMSAFRAEPVTERFLLLGALLPIPVWGGYCWYRLAQEISPHLRDMRTSWQAGWRAALALLRRGGKTR